jgi:hypothetical protein
MLQATVRSAITARIGLCITVRRKTNRAHQHRHDWTSTDNFDLTKNKEFDMKTISAALLGAVLIATAMSAVTPASALGGCGPNGHRNAAGFCVFGGQNQDWCLRKTGHVATRMPNGRMVCLR